MNVYLSAFLVLQLYGTISSHNIVNTENENIKKSNRNDKLHYMDILIEDLLNQHWEKEETICLNKLLDIMNNVKNSTLWAVWVWDSMQTPAGILYGSPHNLGNYDQCMNSPWLNTHPEFRTQYCLANIKLSDTDPSNTIGDPYKVVNYHINTITKNQLKFNKITWGVCIPAECNTKSTSKFVRSMLKYTHLGPEIYKIDVDNCQVAGTTAEHSWGINFLMFLFISVFIISVLCTIINSTQKMSKGVFDSKLLKAFCLTTNASSLIKVSKNDINILHGLRALSCFMVIGVHILFLQQFIGLSNSLTVDKDIDGSVIQTIRLGDYSVDIFLMISGLLRIKSYMSTGKINPFKAILKRYLRYVVTVGVIILLITTLSRQIGDGPLWNLIANEESNACKKNWLSTILMLGNYVDNENICYPVIWTIPCDFHLSVIATLLYWLFQQNKKAAITIYAFLTTLALFLPGALNYYYNLPKVLGFDFRFHGSYKKNMGGNYISTHHRAAPYFIGMALGFFLSTCNPNKHRNMFSKLTSTIGIIFAITIAAINIMGRSSLDNPNSNEWFTYVFSSLHRSIFTCVICCIIIVCEYGNAPNSCILNNQRNLIIWTFTALLVSFLTWPAFIPVSKLSYGVYLVHCLVYSRMIATTRSTIHYDAVLLIIYSVALISISCLAAMLLHLFVEAPTNRITDFMINIKADTEKNETNKTTIEFKNGISHSNGIKKNI